MYNYTKHQESNCICSRRFLQLFIEANRSLSAISNAVSSCGTDTIAGNRVSEDTESDLMMVENKIKLRYFDNALNVAAVMLEHDMHFTICPLSNGKKNLDELVASFSKKSRY